MKTKHPCLPLVFLAAASLAGTTPAGKPPSTTVSQPPVILLKCPDIAVTGMNATLVSTLLGDPQVEVPMDTVRLEATLENVGSEAVPPGTFVYIILKRNGEAVRSATAVDALGIPGSRWTYSVNDSFPHGQKTTYVIQASSTLKECRLSNNLAALTINEKKLHPQGDPDLTVSMFSVEKRWQQNGDRFTASYFLAADVANGGSGYCNSGSSVRFLIDGNQELAVLNVAQDVLPGPGQKRRFTATVPADKIALGDHVVQASIEPPQNERNTRNNLSSNGSPITQSAELPGGILANLEFSPWRLAGKKLSTTIKMTNLQNQGFLKLRMILLKDGDAVKEWTIPSFGPRASSRIHYEEELRSPRVVFGQNRYRAILTSDAGGKPPAGNSILDERTKELSWVEMDEKSLQNSLKDNQKGIARQLYRQNPDYRIQETLARITAEGISIQVKGKKVSNRIPVMDFSAEVVLSPRLAAGRVYFETVKADMQVSSGANDFFAALLAPIIYRSAKAAIEDFAEKELAVNLSPTHAQGARKSQDNAPLGLILVDGALDMYY